MATINIVPEDKLIELGKILKDARNKKNLTTRALADITKTVANSEISLLENAKRTTPNPIALKKLASVLELNYLDLFTLIGYVDKSAEPNLLVTPIPCNQEIKVYGSVSAGSGEVVFGEYIKTVYLPFVAPNCIGIVVNGDSMEPKIPDKSIVVVDTDIKELENRNVGVFIINEESYTKRVVKDGDKQFLTSDNTKYPPIFISPFDEITVVGRVVRVLIEDI